MNFLDFNKRFPTELSIIEYFIAVRYKDGLKCPRCGSTEKVYHQKARPKNCFCNNCTYEYSVFKDTIFEKSCTDLRKWFYTINLMLVSKKGISAKQLQREIGVTYKTAWRMLKQIRMAMGNIEMDKAFEAIVEIDETYIGGKPRKQNKHDNKNDNNTSLNKRGRGTMKTPVVGIKERNSKRVYARVALPNKAGKKLSGKQLFKILDKVCKNDTVIMTDEFSGYNFLDKDNMNNYVHLKVDHSMEYARGIIHTNGIESFWALLKRGIYGIYHHVSIKYMQNYINEFCYRMNNRNSSSFDVLLKQCVTN